MYIFYNERPAVAVRRYSSAGGETPPLQNMNFTNSRAYNSDFSEPGMLCRIISGDSPCDGIRVKGQAGEMHKSVNRLVNQHVQPVFADYPPFPAGL